MQVRCRQQFTCTRHQQPTSRRLQLSPANHLNYINHTLSKNPKPPDPAERNKSPMTQIQDVVIVGGGAAGCAVAYYLAKAGVKSTIIERDGIAANASGYSAGGLNPLEGAGIPGPLGALAIRSYRMHAQNSRPS